MSRRRSTVVSPGRTSGRFADPSGIVHVDDGRNVADHVDVHSDCDSEGNEPPTFGAFVPPASMEGVFAPPPRTNAEIKLPFSTVRERVRYRDQYASKLYYEEWVEGEGADVTGIPAASGSAKSVKKLEADSDYPVGKPYFWRAVCPPCNETYYPHIPSMWTCPMCKRRVWQLPDDPESKACGVCRRPVARIRTVAGKRIRSPLVLNGHNCKRCGRVVCDDCYDPNAVNVPVYGYTQPVKVCTDCVKDIRQELQAPEEEDLGAREGVEEYAVQELSEAMSVLPHWPPFCSSCGVHLGQPPPKWECRTCHGKVWQPTDAPQSAACWICQAKFPKVRCHRCGQLVCDSCGSCAQPLPELGFDTGEGLSVCRGCYAGVSYGKDIMPTDIYSALMREREAKRAGGGGRGGGGAVSSCSVCTSPCADGTRKNCAFCGSVCCLTCTQYKETPPGAPKGAVPQTICLFCFDPRKALLPDHRDQSFWPPRCPVCCRTWLTPPERWRCPFNCGNVWQPITHIASKACASCGKPTGGSPVNCRCCGRVVCGPCGSSVDEVPEMGFTRGAKVPRCSKCKRPGSPDAGTRQPQEQQQTDSRSAAPAQRGGTPGRSATSPSRTPNRIPSPTPTGRGGRGGGGVSPPRGRARGR